MATKAMKAAAKAMKAKVAMKAAGKAPKKAMKAVKATPEAPKKAMKLTRKDEKAILAIMRSRQFWDEYWRLQLEEVLEDEAEAAKKAKKAMKAAGEAPMKGDDPRIWPDQVTIFPKFRIPSGQMRA